LSFVNNPFGTSVEYLSAFTYLYFISRTVYWFGEWWKCEKLI